jgi:glycosyltransferase involved in cell wall biosynthesis
VKVLILHHHFNTPRKGGALRSYYLAKALVDRGVQATVITTHNDSTVKIEDVDGITVHYLPIAYDNKFGFYQRGLSFLKYIIHAFRVAGKLRDIDLCYAISVPLTIGISALWIKRWYKIPFVFEVGDLWPDAPVQLGFVKNYFLKEYLYSLERSIYKRAEFVVALSTAIQQSIEKKIPGKKVVLISNMADTKFFKPALKNNSLQKKFGVNERFVVSYIGALGFANGLDHLLECARASKSAGLAVQFLLCGDGAMLDYLQRSAKHLELDNVTFIPFQNRDGVSEVMNVSDAIFICYKPVAILETGSPNKYFEGLAASKLILINFGGWIKNEIAQEECGEFIDPRNPASFVSIIRPYLKDTSLLVKKQHAARMLAERKYSRELISEKFFKSIVNK